MDKQETFIGQFNDAYYPVIDGVTLTTENYAYWLNKKNIKTCVVAPKYPLYVDDDRFPVLRFFSIPIPRHSPYRLGLPGLDTAFMRSIQNKGFSLIHCHSPFGAGRLGLKIAHSQGIPIISTFHAKYREDLLRHIRVPKIVDGVIKSMVSFYNKMDAVWVPQESVITTLREYGYHGPYEVMENGIDMHVPTDLAPLRLAGAQHLRIPDSIFLCLFVGQHILEKNLMFLLKSLKIVCATTKNFRMIFVGEGYAKPALQTWVRTNQLENRIFFHDKVIDRTVLSNIYARADLLTFPSMYDNAPLVVREAAAHKTPSLLLKGSNASEVIHDNQNGFLSEPDIESYAKRIKWLVANQKKCASVAELASKTLCRSWESVLDQASKRYEEIIKVHARRKKAIFPTFPLALPVTNALPLSLGK